MEKKNDRKRNNMEAQKKAEGPLEGKTIAIDFDGVIHKYHGWIDAKTIDGPPVEGALDWLREIYCAGGKIIIHSARCRWLEGKLAIQNWFIQNGLNGEIIARMEYVAKPPAWIYIDDRGWRFYGETLPSIGAIAVADRYHPKK